MCVMFFKLLLQNNKKWCLTARNELFSYKLVRLFLFVYKLISFSRTFVSLDIRKGEYLQHTTILNGTVNG